MSSLELVEIAGPCPGPCPGEDTLAAFAAGELNSLEIAQHAAGCEACSQQLMAANAGLWDAPSASVAPAHTATAEPLNGRYMLIQKLGEGGMGIVYEAEDLVLGERVALKTLRVELACDERALGYLKSEAKLARQIGHEHVCRVYDLGSQTIAGATLHYISMELLRGPSLRRLLHEGPLDHRLALSLAHQVLCGLQAAHAAGVLHRDLKPDNMLLRHPSPQLPHVVITDFGLARAFQAGQRHVSASRLLVGSAAYLAPEQMDEAPLTEATDLYSFGVVLFELLTGKLPFCAKTPLGVALRRLHTPAPRPSAMRPELGERYDAFVLRCLARDPRDRFQSAASARAALQKLIGALDSGQRRSLGVRARAALTAVCVGAAAIGLRWSQTPEVSLGATAASSSAQSLPLTAASTVLPLAAASGGACSASASDLASTRASAPVADEHAVCAAESRAVRGAQPEPAPKRMNSGARAKRHAPLVRALTQPRPPQLLSPEGFLDPFSP